MQELQSEGYVVRQQGRGTYIHKAVTPKASAEADSKMVGAVVPGIEINYYTEMVQGFQAEAANRGYSIIVCDSLFSTERERTLLEHMSRQSISRLLVFPFFTDSVDPEYAELIRRIIDSGIKVVLVDQFSVRSGYPIRYGGQGSDGIYCRRAPHYAGAPADSVRQFDEL